MLHITFLGTSGSIPSSDRGMPAISLKWDKHFVFDFGEGTQRQMMKYKVGYGSVFAVFISHLHLDHFLGLYGYLETLSLMDRKEKLFIFSPPGLPVIKDHGFVVYKEIKEGPLFRGRDYTISAFRVRHGRRAYGFVFQEDRKPKFDGKKARELGLRGEDFKVIQKKGKVFVRGREVSFEDVAKWRKGTKVVYSGDTLPCKEVINAAKDADLLIHEATFDDEEKKEAEKRNHSTFMDAVRIAKEAGVKKLILTHISPRYRGDKLKEIYQKISKEFSDVHIAFDGMHLSVLRRMP